MGAVAANIVVSWTDSDGGDHDGSLFTRAHGFDVIACAICGFRHVTPLPDTAGLEHAYRETITPKRNAHAGEDEDGARLAGKRSARGFERLSPSSRHASSALAWWKISSMPGPPRSAFHRNKELTTFFLVSSGVPAACIVHAKSFEILWNW
jgi:hypothetical protein